MVHSCMPVGLMYTDQYCDVPIRDLADISITDYYQYHTDSKSDNWLTIW